MASLATDAHAFSPDANPNLHPHPTPTQARVATDANAFGPDVSFTYKEQPRWPSPARLTLTTP